MDVAGGALALPTSSLQCPASGPSSRGLTLRQVMGASLLLVALPISVSYFVAFSVHCVVELGIVLA